MGYQNLGVAVLQLARVSIVCIDPSNLSLTGPRQIDPFPMRRQDSKPPRKCAEHTGAIYTKSKS
jgi:hypothetical protein